ncbi:short-chain oxidoreductase [Punctularia strigosozonata HHB-11173 SS5]|uniref:short-chain oxidoreductase n=1 Tax=Punctularia strigosozonata (strain HHB-11173) TaxID=741275 RepID=UPI0004416F46|nr:short-chain oxidoreductase [Punctularia strigosozonata HHB-11173 SS5]EIN09067.1 short-chain oxidoreductase [Punctularia strigosozonata HHB-11173 SS5]
MVALLSPRDQKVWFVTGTSSGLGRAIVYSALSRGDKVIATSRTLASIRDLQSPCCHIMQLDVTDSPAVLDKKAEEAIRIFGRVDVVVNNAGFGAFGIAEEIGAEGFMKQYQTNVFGVINVTNAFLPHMRARRDGTIVNVGSRSAWRTSVPMIAAYTSSKAALRALTETMAVEVAPFGVRMLLVEPGGLRTANFNNKQVLERRRPSPEAYDRTRQAALAWVDSITGKEPGDPFRAAHAIADVVRGEGAARNRPWPGQLILGEDAAQDVRAKAEAVIRHLDEWKDVRDVAIAQ